MKKIFGLVGIALAMILSGCSNKPEASDIEPVLKSFWEPCNFVKVTKVTKTNGAERGTVYDMDIAYKLEITKDLAVEDIWSSNLPAYVPMPLERISAPGAGVPDNSAQLGAENDRANAAYYAAKKRLDDSYNNNCPQQFAGLFQKFFAEKNGQPLKKGDSVDMTNTYTMIKSEKGWIMK